MKSTQTAPPFATFEHRCSMTYFLDRMTLKNGWNHCLNRIPKTEGTCWNRKCIRYEYTSLRYWISSNNFIKLGQNIAVEYLPAVPRHFPFFHKPDRLWYWQIAIALLPPPPNSQRMYGLKWLYQSAWFKIASNADCSLLMHQTNSWIDQSKPNSFKI